MVRRKRIDVTLAGTAAISVGMGVWALPYSLALGATLGIVAYVALTAFMVRKDGR